MPAACRILLQGQSGTAGVPAESRFRGSPALPVRHCRHAGSLQNPAPGVVRHCRHAGSLQNPAPGAVLHCRRAGRILLQGQSGTAGVPAESCSRGSPSLPACRQNPAPGVVRHCRHAGSLQNPAPGAVRHCRRAGRILGSPALPACRQPAESCSRGSPALPACRQNPAPGVVRHCRHAGSLQNPAPGVVRHCRHAGLPAAGTGAGAGRLRIPSTLPAFCSCSTAAGLLQVFVTSLQGFIRAGARPAPWECCRLVL